jgi:hypothetical protein
MDFLKAEMERKRKMLQEKDVMVSCVSTNFALY